MAVMTPVLDMKKHNAGLPAQPEALLNHLKRPHILRALQRFWRIDEGGINAFARPGAGSISIELGKSAFNVLRHSACDLGELDLLIVCGVEKMRGKPACISCLKAGNNHGARPSASKHRSRISARSRTAASAASGSVRDWAARKAVAQRPSSARRRATSS
ncbi:hypothetical protein R2G56_04975 [Nitratireductor aquimarinus]|uniref:Uncharacterized protein n=1 Tax=Nitratireductor aquimarinus TaxID=889300 RepID=A0ABU4AHA8_9HYPH|nr:hypothetical protein [Nitratireductor aquimarinus]MDV6225632.1 hypothetical protein [Nitratireductor aquimarinus]